MSDNEDEITLREAANTAPRLKCSACGEPYPYKPRAKIVAGCDCGAPPELTEAGAVLNAMLAASRRGKVVR